MALKSHLNAVTEFNKYIINYELIHPVTFNNCDILVRVKNKGQVDGRKHNTNSKAKCFTSRTSDLRLPCPELFRFPCPDPW